MQIDPYNSVKTPPTHRFMPTIDFALEQRTSKALSPPSMYALVMLNDDVTPINFVVDVLKRFVHMSTTNAISTTFAIHHQGESKCGIYTRDIGETKIAQIHAYAKQHGYPLRCILRKTQ